MITLFTFTSSFEFNLELKPVCEKLRPKCILKRVHTSTPQLRGIGSQVKVRLDFAQLVQSLINLCTFEKIIMDSK